MRRPMAALRFLVNRRSGGGYGGRLAESLAPYGPVHDMAELHRLPELATDGERVVAVGGDGTVAAVIAVLGGRLPVGVVAVGTGNDFARAQGWPLRMGDPAAYVQILRSAPVVTARRCRLMGPGLDHPFCLYVSLGWDAAVAGRFHAWRETRPGWFRSSSGNKMIYAAAGLLTGRLDLAGVAVNGAPVPPRTGSVLVLAAASYAGGACPPAPSSLDVHLLPAGLAFAWARFRARSWRPLAAAGEQILELSRPIAAQADGEPLILGPGRYRLVVEGDAPVLAGPLRR